MDADVLIIGSGIAGLSVALSLQDRDVLIISSGSSAKDGSSHLAQGGMAAALGAGDGPLHHAADTLMASDGLADDGAVSILTRDAPGAVGWLEKLGVRFDRDAQGHLRLGREAAHRFERIVHSGGDATGARIMQALWRQVCRRAHLSVRSGTHAIRLARNGSRICGAWVIDDKGDLARITAREVVLACGGSGGLYARTTNPATVCGSAIGLASEAGARLADLEFVQFHPTALDVATDGTALPLATEALRGAGARMIDEQGRPFMTGIHPDLELAPRNVVALAVHRLQRQDGRAFLDATSAVGPAFPQRFPTVFRHCRRHGIDPVKEPIPITPAAHYHMGGVAVNLFGRTDLPGLWAVGEAACTGVHGANRLASNSLVEGVVLGRRLAAALSAEKRPGVSSDDEQPTMGSIPCDNQELRHAMWRFAGLERTDDGLARLSGQIEDWLSKSVRPMDRLKLLAAREIARFAWRRKDSVGAHIRTDGHFLHIA